MFFPPIAITAGIDFLAPVRLLVFAHRSANNLTATFLPGFQKVLRADLLEHPLSEFRLFLALERAEQLGTTGTFVLFSAR